MRGTLSDFVIFEGPKRRLETVGIQNGPGPNCLQSLSAEGNVLKRVFHANQICMCLDPHLN